MNATTSVSAHGHKMYVGMFLYMFLCLFIYKYMAKIPIFSIKTKANDKFIVRL